MRIACGEVLGLVISWRIGADKEDALNQKQNKKD
jgi:hypothetical protein